jgi:hypothetical protein
MTDLSYECSWNTSIALEDWIGPNRYNCKIYFDIETDDGEQQNIAFERCKIMVESVLEHAFVIGIDNPLLQVLAKKTKQKIITLPSEPIDVIMAAVLYTKLNAVSEGRLSIRKVKLSSSQGDNIFVHFDEDFAEDFGSLNCELYKTVDETPWWFRADPSVSDWFEIGKKEIKFHHHKCSWDKTLQWEKQNNDNKKKDTKKSPTWNPQVIDGGKETKH